MHRPRTYQKEERDQEIIVRTDDERGYVECKWV